MLEDKSDNHEIGGYRDAEHSECKVAWKRVGIYGVDYTTGRPEWCPLTEVEPYGIDGLLYKEK